MSANGILRNPYIFDFERGSDYKCNRNGIKMCWEFLRYVEKYGVVQKRSINDHILMFCEEYLNGDENKKNWDIRKLLRRAQKVYTLPQLIACVEVLEVRLNMKPSITKTKCSQLLAGNRHGLALIVTQIRKNKVINVRLQKQKRNKKSKRLAPYHQRVNALFNQNDSDSD
eukprot:UN04990